VGNRAKTAPIILDGHELFQVSRLQNYTAADRANQINQQLAQTMKTSGHPQVEISRWQNSLTLRIADQHLITITKQDLRTGVGPSEQARVWQQKLNQALQKAHFERTTAYRRQALLGAAGLLGIVIGLNVGIQWIRQRSRRRLKAKKHAVLLGLITLQWGLLWGGVYYVCEQFPSLRSLRYTLINSFSQPLFELSDKAYSLIDLVFLVVLVIGMWLLVRGFTLLLKSRILQMTGVARGVQDAIAILTQYTLTLLGLVVILQIAGVDVSSLLILGGALGVGIGFGLQNIVNNFFSGIIILLERPIEAGDFIHVGDLVGTVEHINARSTEIRTLDQVTIIVPNATFTEKEVVNWSHGNPVARLHLPVGVAYGSPIAIVQIALLDAVKDHPDVLAYPQPQINFQGFGDSSLDFDVLVWFCEPRQQYRIKSDLYYRIEASLQQYHIEIPFPQRDVHVRSQQLDQLLELLIKKEQPDLPHLYYPGHSQTPDFMQTPSKEIRPPLPPLQSIPNIALDLDTLAGQLRSSISIEDRRYRLNLYPRCFVGSEAVAWLMTTQKATKVEAIRLGQALIDRKIIHHVLDEHAFADAYLFYRFYSDEPNQADSRNTQPAS